MLLAKLSKLPSNCYVKYIPPDVGTYRTIQSVFPRLRNAWTSHCCNNVP